MQSSRRGCVEDSQELLYELTTGLIRSGARVRQWSLRGGECEIDVYSTSALADILYRLERQLGRSPLVRLDLPLLRTVASHGGAVMTMVLPTADLQRYLDAIEGASR